MVLCVWIIQFWRVLNRLHLIWRAWHFTMGLHWVITKILRASNWSEIYNISIHWLTDLWFTEMCFVWCCSHKLDFVLYVFILLVFCLVLCLEEWWTAVWQMDFVFCCVYHIGVLCCVWKSGGQQFGRCHSLSWRQEVTQVRHYFGCYTFVFWPSYLYLLLCNFNLEGSSRAIQRR